MVWTAYHNRVIARDRGKVDAFDFAQDRFYSFNLPHPLDECFRNTLRVAVS
jgi:hypothetical protein